MSFVTRCTSCGTLFKVVADQLKISEGWVRCGQCATVFDAQANLVQAPSAPIPIASAAHAIPEQHTDSLVPENNSSYAIDSIASDADSMRANSLNPLDHDALLAAFSPSRSMSAPRADAATLPAQLLPLAHDSSPSAEPSLFSGFSTGFSDATQGATEANTKPDAAAPNSHFESQGKAPSFYPGKLRDKTEIDSDAGPSTASWAASEYPLDSMPPKARGASGSVSAEPTTLHPTSGMDATSLPVPDVPAPSTTPQPLPSFVKQARRAQRWRSPVMRFSLCLLALALLCALALQVALHDKDRIAAQWPQTKSGLEQLCAYAGCQVRPFKRIEAIAVDSSSFNRINKSNAPIESEAQSYRLAVTLKNTGHLPVALPHVELSLQDAQDQAIFRRVLSPSDLGSTLQAIAPSQDMAGSLSLQIDTAQLAGRKIQGYRVLAFYP